MTPDRLKAILDGYDALRVAVLGDFCLDRYMEIDPTLEEISIETGLPAHQVTRVRSQPGGAGTVLGNVAALGVKEMYAVGFCGEDGEGYELLRALRGIGANLDHFLRTPERCTFTYCKPLMTEPGKPPRELSRLDTKNRTATPAGVEQHFLNALSKIFPAVDAVVVMEQMEREGFGAVTPAVKVHLAELSRAHPEVIVLADSRVNISTFHDVMIKVNDKELAVHFEREAIDGTVSRKLIARWADELRRNVFVTLGPDGILAATPEGQVDHVPGIRLAGALDIVGAGDSVLAGIGCALAAGASPIEAATIGNLAGSVVVQKIGTTGTASRSELTAAFCEHLA